MLAGMDVAEAAVLDNGAPPTGVVEDSARHHVLVVVVRRLTIPVAVVRTRAVHRSAGLDVAVHSAGDIAVPPTKANLDEESFFLAPQRMASPSTDDAPWREATSWRGTPPRAGTRRRPPS
jgi:hypothetical protein